MGFSTDTLSTKKKSECSIAAFQCVYAMTINVYPAALLHTLWYLIVFRVGIRCRVMLLYVMHPINLRFYNSVFKKKSVDI